MDKFKVQNILFLISYTLIIGGGIGAILYYCFEGQYFPQWYGYIILFFFTMGMGMINAVDKGSKKLDSKKLVNLYMGIRVAKLLFALIFVAVYWFVIKEGIKNFALVFMTIYFFYIFFDIYYLSRIEKRLKENKGA